MKALRLFCAAAFASSLLLSGCGVTTPLINPQEQSAPAQISQSQMHNAIIRAAQLRKWRIVSDRPGVVTLAYPGSAKAIHFEAIVKVTYNAQRYKVSYVSSRGLDERKGCVNSELKGNNKYDENALCVHRNVNRWMNNLNADILDALYR